MNPGKYIIHIHAVTAAFIKLSDHRVNVGTE